MRTGQRGRPRLVLAEGFLLGQVVKSYVKRRVVGVTRRVVHGSLGAIEGVLKATGTGKGIHTAYIERLNATFRGALVLPGKDWCAVAGPLPTRRECSRRACIWWVVPTISVGIMRAFAWLLPLAPTISGRNGRQRWRQDLQTTPGACWSY